MQKCCISVISSNFFKKIGSLEEKGITTCLFFPGENED